ncbi:MAG: MBL fold metallo-hydrolase [Candidatus Aenigmarchaeota archaeon]|nr:MBL fold metallo-hydrolase [Candidatus Aenigmarchaeota archaeon]
MKNFEIKNIDKGIFLIKEKLYKESANLYLIKGNKFDLLIDTGTGIWNLKKEIQKITKNKILVVNTHAHFDHCGGNYQFKNIAIHKIENTFLKKPDKENTASFLFEKSDIKAPIPIKEYKVKYSKASKILSNAKEIDLGNKKIKVIHTPGHSPGSICMYNKEKQILFSGDLIYNGKLLFNLSHSNKKRYIKSLKKISKLKIKKVFPGHNEAFDGIKLKKMIFSAIKLLKIEKPNNL